MSGGAKQENEKEKHPFMVTPTVEPQLSAATPGSSKTNGVKFEEKKPEIERQGSYDPAKEDAGRLNNADREGKNRRQSVFSNDKADKNAENFKAPVFAKTDADAAFIKKTINSSILFAHVDDLSKDVLVGAFHELQFKPNEKLIAQGDIGDNYYILQVGKCECYVSKPGWAPSGQFPQYGKMVCVYEPGGSFGELALLYDAPRAATVIAVKDSKVWALDRVTFKTIICKSQQLSREGHAKALEALNPHDDALSKCTGCFQGLFRRH